MADDALDSEIAGLLSAWGIPHDIVQNFITNGITIEHFPQLTPENLKELCPHLGHRISLSTKIAELITACAPTESIATTTSAANSEVDQGVVISLDDISFTEAVLQPSTSSTSEVVTRTFPNFDLTTLLQTTAGGNSVLKFYETFGYLDNCKRKQLTDIIIKHIYTYIVHNRITYEEYNILAAKIITVFPKETIGTYFTRPVKKCSSINGRSLMARGKLVDKVRNLLYKYGDRKRRSSDNSENIEYPLKKACIKELHDSHSTDIIWMSCNSEPWEEVIKKWTATFEIRKECSYSNIHEIFKEFKILQDQRSDTLINIDFDLLYPEKGLNFFLNWDNFFTKITTLKPTHDERLNEIMQSLQNIEDDVKLPAQLHILGHLVPPKGRLSKKVKFTTQESIDSIFICVENAGDIDSVIERQKEKALANKLLVQPYIILQGSMMRCSTPLLIIDSIRYQFTSIKKAFDTLFKAYHVFQARYPIAGDHLYLIIQRCIYRIETKYDNVVPYISHVLSMKY